MTDCTRIYRAAVQDPTIATATAATTWWERRAINPVATARMLWISTRYRSNQRRERVTDTLCPTPVSLDRVLKSYAGSNYRWGDTSNAPKSSNCAADVTKCLMPSLRLRPGGSKLCCLIYLMMIR